MENLKDTGRDHFHQDRGNENLLQEIKILQSVLESTSDSIFSFDRNFNYTAFNKAHQRDIKLGRGVDLKIGDNYLEIVQRTGGEDSNKIKEIFNRVMSGETIETIEEFGDPKLRRAFYSMICNPMYDDEGNINGVTVFCQDVTQRIRLKKEFEEKTRLLNGVLENLPVVIYEMDPTGMFTRSIGAGLKALGLKDNALVGQNAFDAFPQAADDLRRGLEGKTMQFTSLVNTDGGEFMYQNNIFPHPDHKGSIIGFALDITKQKEAEQEMLKATRIAEEAALAKQQFLSNMSHEIRTPMNAVIGMTHLLLHEDPKQEQLENLKTLKFSSENLLSLINDILDYSKIELGKIILEQTDFNLPELMNSIKQTHSLQAEEHCLNFEVLVDPEIPEGLIGDPVRLTQIINNLVSNALKFTVKGSVVVGLSLKAQTENLVHISFTVTDTGIGIDPDLKAYIFESFTQASADTTRKFGGTGLGLAITKGLVELQGSEIFVESILGEGSKFYFDLAFKKSTKKTGYGYVTPTLEFDSLAGYRILLAEDNEINKVVASKFMKKWDLEIDHAGNGAEALEKVIEKEYDMVLMDLQMPKMDGYTASRAIRDLPGARFKELPIIALTASVLAEINRKVLDAGMNDYVSKPFNPMELYTKITQYIRGK